MKQFSPRIPVGSFRLFNACLLSLLMLTTPLAPLAASVNRIAAAHAEQKAARKLANSAKKQLTPREALERSLFVNPLPTVGPIISATLRDSFVDNNATNRADPGSVVTYTAVVSNTGSGDASNVSFTDTPDPNTTLVGGSVKISPLALNDSYNATKNTQLVIAAPGVLTNDTGTPLPTAVPIAAGPTAQPGGVVTLNSDGSFTYDPPNGYTGPDSFTYTATNGQAPPNPSDAMATVTITVKPPNTPPVANDDAASATEAGGVNNGTPGTNPAGNLVTGTGAPGAVADTDAEDPSSALVVVAVHTGPEGGSTGTGTVGSPLAGTYGSLTLNSDGSYTYTVDNNNATVQALRTSGQTLQDVFNYTIKDTGNLQDTATFTITIAGANDNPVAVADTATAVEAGGTNNGTPGTDPSGNVLTNDTDVDSVANGETKTVQGVAVGTQAGPLSTNVGVGLSGAGALNYGTLTIAANGAYTYVVNQTNAAVEALNTGGTLTDTFSYTMKDAANATSTTTITITIQGADDNPVAVADSATVLEDAAATAVLVLTNDTDVDGGPKSIGSVTQPTNGAVVITGGGTGLTYQPNANYCNHSPGATFDTFTYTLNGGSTATVSMTVTCVNDPPVNTVPGPQFVADTGTLTFNTANSNVISVADVDAGAGTVKVTVSVPATKGTLVPASGSGSTIVGSGTNSVTITGTLTQVNAALNGLVYTPPAGTTQAVTLTVLTDDQGNTGTGGAQTDTDTVTINVDQAPTVTATTPSTPAGTQDNITITFSEPVNVSATDWFQIVCTTTGTRNPADTVVTGGPTTWTINPNVDFAAGETCTVTVFANKVNDLDLNDPPDNMAANKVFSFTMDVAPTVTNTVPSNLATGVSPAATITVTFSESVAATTSSFTINCTAAGAKTFTLSASPSTTFTLTPTGGLPPGDHCTVNVVANQISDTDTADPPDHMVADFPFSFDVRPDAIDDTYPQTVIGNVNIDSSLIPYSVTTNDISATAFTITSSNITTANGGQVVMTTSGPNLGKFTYNPPPGFEGTDTFTYTITNAAGSDTATVSIPVSGMIWFINNAGGAGDGRLSSPYNTLAAFNTANALAGGLNPDNNDNIFIYESATGYSGAVTLRTGQKLIGQDATASLSTITGLTPPSGSAAFPAMNSGNATVTNITSTVTLNTNTTVRGLSINSTTSTGMNDPAGAITGVNVSEVAITATTGSGIVLSSAGGTFSFSKISSGSGGTSPGISLTSTTGSFTVLGDGGGSNNGSGGSITNKTGTSETTGTPGVRLNNVQNVQLNYMNITGNNHSGIYGTTVNGFKLNRCIISNNGDSNVSNPDETGVDLHELTGTAIGGANPTSITNTTISNNFEIQVEITNTTGTLTDLQMSGNAISSTGASGVVGDLFQLLGQGTSTTKLTLTSGTFTGNAPATATAIFCNSGGTSMTCNISGATFTNNNVGVDVSTDPVSTTLNFNISSNTFTGGRAQAINQFNNGNSPFTRTVNGKILSNTIGTAGVANSGSTVGRGIDVGNEGAIATEDLLINGNTIQEIQSFEGIGVNVGLTGLVTGGGATNLTITGNTIREIHASRGLIISDNQTTAPNFPTICANISGNTFGPNIAGQAGNLQFMRLKRDFGTFNVTHATPTVAANVAELDDANGFNDPTKISLAGSPSFSQPACSQPPIANPDGGDIGRIREALPDLHNTATTTVAQTLVQPRVLRSSTSDRKANHASRTLAANHSATTRALLTPLAPPPLPATVNAAIGTLPAGKSVKITFQVTLNVAMPAGTTTVSTQGKVFYTGGPGGGVLTDDPDVPPNTGETDPTVTPIDAPTAAGSTVSGRILDNNGNPVEGAVIRLSGTQNRKTITDANGNYNFFEVDTNGFYTVTPSRVNYDFAPATRGFSALGAHAEASFAGTFNGNHQNPLDTTEYFVRQQYVDFLGREPEEKGFNDWTDTINNCAPGDASCDRVHVSEAFFRSAEFQQRGYFVYRFYSTALGRKPDFAEFTPDISRVSGFLTNDQLEAAKTAFANDFVNRPAFAQYATLTNAQFVDALSRTAGVTLSNRPALVASLDSGTLTRAQALRQIAESGEVYAKYYNQAFVVMEYFGYLRRDPDILYLDWIAVLDANPADSRRMVEGFVDATEYRNRFKR